MEGHLDFFLIACQKADKEEAAEYERTLQFDSNVAEDEIFIGTIIPLDESLSEKDNININNDEAND